MSIIFSQGFSITQGGYTPPPGQGDYYILEQYNDAAFQGQITIPKHDNSTWSNDFNDVNENTGNAIYINTFDNNGNDNSAFLNQLVGNHTHLTFSQNQYHITFDCSSAAWENGYNQVYHDPTYGNAPQNSMTIISSSGVAFNNVDPITISIQVI